MLLTLDVGNTNITMGVYDGDTLLFVSRMSTKTPRMEDQYAAEILSILSLYGVESKQIDGAVLSSVVPRLTDYLTKAIRRVWHVDPFVVSTVSVPEVTVKPGVSNELGADLVVGSVAALHQHKPPMIVIDMGTATTMVVLDKTGALVGGSIIPGVKISLDALTDRTALLPGLQLDQPKKAIGRNTIDCMRSGIMMGTACMIDGMIDRMEQELGYKTTVVVTGGIAKFILPMCSHEVIYDKDLLLKGLAALYRDNKR